MDYYCFIGLSQYSCLPRVPISHHSHTTWDSGRHFTLNHLTPQHGITRIATTPHHQNPTLITVDWSAVNRGDFDRMLMFQSNNVGLVHQTKWKELEDGTLQN